MKLKIEMDIEPARGKPDAPKDAILDALTKELLTHRLHVHVNEGNRFYGTQVEITRVEEIQ